MSQVEAFEANLRGAPACATGARSGLAPMLISFAVSATAFVLTLGWRPASCLLLALLLHESGHALGMRAFGYRRIRMIFLPFLGGFAAGEKPGAPAGQEAAVLLLGPLPGLALSSAIATTWPRQVVLPPGSFPAPPWGVELAASLVFLNAFNLLPIYPLDGGRLLLLFAPRRSPWFSVGFPALSFSVLILVGLASGGWLLTGAGVLGIATLPFTAGRAFLMAGVRRRWAFPPSPDRLTTRDVRRLFWLARRLDPSEDDPQILASWARTFLEQLGSSAPAPAQRVGIAVAYAVCWALAFFASHRIPEIRLAD